MGFNMNTLQVFHKAWFHGTPQNAKKASAVLTFDGAVVAEETVTIGGKVFEFVADAEDVADGTDYAVVVGATLTADNAVTKLADAINANLTDVVAVKDTTKDTCTITYKAVGTEGNSITVETDCTHASFGKDVDGEDVDSLSGGQYATPCKASTAAIVIDNTIYFTNKPCTKWTEDAWYSASTTLL